MIVRALYPRAYKDKAGGYSFAEEMDCLRPLPRKPQ
jgi:hypothetical protein